jgi:transposase
MSSVQTATDQNPRGVALRTENAVLKQQVQTLKTQLDWFKRQLFGAKSEKRLLIDPSIQADLLAELQPTLPLVDPPAIEKITYERRKQRNNTVADSGLRFDDSVPVETIHLGPAPELADVPADQQQLISEKISYRLAQRPGSYVVLKYVRSVIKNTETGELITSPVANNVLDRSIADVSLLAGMLVDKFVYHLPLYRQHQRIRQSGIDLSRATLNNLASRAIRSAQPNL